MGKININTILEKKSKEKIVAITAYDYTFAKIIDQCDVDLILVGDSSANVCAGHNTTLPITLDEMIFLSKSVRRGVKKSFLMSDLPFLSYQASVEQAVMSAGRLMKEAEVEGVKLEGGEIMAETVYKLTRIGIPVMGHIGLTAQSEHQLGGRHVHGKTNNQAERLLKDAKILEEAGAFSILLEMITSELAKKITDSVKIPTVGIGSGKDCDGQILVCYDLLGLDDSFNPKFLRKYAGLSTLIRNAVNTYSSDVRSILYPGLSESY